MQTSTLFSIFTTLLAASAAPAAAVGVEICYGHDFAQPCVTLTGASGQCLLVPTGYNDHVSSARSLSGTCDSYKNTIGGKTCDGLLTQGIDTAGYGGLPGSDQTSGFICY